MINEKFESTKLVPQVQIKIISNQFVINTKPNHTNVGWKSLNGYFGK